MVLNLALLGADTYLAHSVSGTIRAGEWIPIIFGPLAAAALLAAGVISLRRRMLGNWISTAVFLVSIAVGILGSYYHLNRAFLADAPAGQQLSAAVLLYAPPLLGPITFALIAVLGLSAVWQEDPLDSGRLILPGGLRLNLPLSKTRAYFLIVAVFILLTLLDSVLDHARTNFENPWLWLPTFAGAFAVLATLSMGALRKIERGDLLTFIGAMGLLIVVGLTGFVLHILNDLPGQGVLQVERFIRGAPLMAPLLFANVAAMGLMVLLDPAGAELKIKQKS
jgi:hypothetical protein